MVEAGCLVVAGSAVEAGLEMASCVVEAFQKMSVINM